MPTHHRSVQRAQKISLRFSVEEVERLRLEAAAEGYSSLQQLAEARFFGAARPRRKSGPKSQSEQLEMSA
jgi:hypothetical protein